MELFTESTAEERSRRSFIAFTPDTRPKCPVCGALGVVSVERGGGDPAYTLYYCSEQRHPYYLPQRIEP